MPEMLYRMEDEINTMNRHIQLMNEIRDLIVTRECKERELAEAKGGSRCVPA